MPENQAGCPILILGIILDYLTLTGYSLFNFGNADASKNALIYGVLRQLILPTFNFLSYIIKHSHRFIYYAVMCDSSIFKCPTTQISGAVSRVRWICLVGLYSLLCVTEWNPMRRFSLHRSLRLYWNKLKSRIKLSLFPF